MDENITIIFEDDGYRIIYEKVESIVIGDLATY